MRVLCSQRCVNTTSMGRDDASGAMGGTAANMSCRQLDNTNQKQ